MYNTNRCTNTGRITRNDALSTKGARVVERNGQEMFLIAETG
jgi:hypothetical protein